MSLEVFSRIVPQVVLRCRRVWIPEGADKAVEFFGRAKHFPRLAEWLAPVGN